MVLPAPCLPQTPFAQGREHLKWTMRVSCFLSLTQQFRDPVRFRPCYIWIYPSMYIRSYSDRFFRTSQRSGAGSRVPRIARLPAQALIGGVGFAIGFVRSG